MMNEEIKLIENVIEEAITMKVWGKRDGLEQYEIMTIDGEEMPADYSLIVSLDKNLRVKGMNQAYFQATSLGTDNYYGELEVFYCKKKKGLFGKETLKTLKSYSKRYHIDALENGTEAKTKLKELMSEK